MEENIYQYARLKKKQKDKRLTQAYAAELLGIDETTLRKYELDKGIPHEDTVEVMEIIYDAPWLMHKHLENKDPTNSIPCLRFRELDNATLFTQKELNDVTTKLSRFIEISCDNKIDIHELEDAKDYKKEVMELIEALLSLQYALDKEITEIEE